jgi:translation elongation factor EF-1alpha
MAKKRKRKSADTGWVQLTSDEKWKDGETLVGTFIKAEKPKGRKVKGRLLHFRVGGVVVKRWSAAILDMAIESGDIKKGTKVKIKAHPKRKGGRGKIRPFDIAIKK